MMSCCGCASRVLKLQSEIRSWKTRLGDEKREKKMILRWIMAVFGYDVSVEIEKETHVVRLQATENKEAMSKAIIKSVIGTEGDCGVMLMEVKLGDNEYYEAFEDPYDVPEFPILEINSMTTGTQAPLVNTGITPYGHLSHSTLNPPQALSITTPMEIASAPLPAAMNQEPEVMYISGNLEEGSTLEGPNGQSYIIVRANDAEELSVPVPMEYSAIVNDSVNVISDNNVYFRPGLQPGQDNITALNYLTSAKPIPAPLPIPSIVKSETMVPIPTLIPQFGMEVKESGSTSSSKSSSKKKTSLSSSSKPSMKVSSKKKSSVGDGEMDIKIKSVSSKATLSNSVLNATLASFTSKSEVSPVVGSKKVIESGSGAQSAKGDVLGLTLREKAEVFVLQKAREAVAKLSNGKDFGCTVCKDSRYIYPNIEMAIAHAKTHFESKPYKCDFCDDLFAIQRELLAHRKTVHSKPKGAVTSTSSSPRLSSQSQAIHKSADTKVSTIANTTPDQFRVSSSGTIIPNNSTSSISNSSTTKTIVVQAPFDKNLIRGPISVSNEVLAAILGGGVKVTFSSPDSNNIRNLTRF